MYPVFVKMQEINAKKAPKRYYFLEIPWHVERHDQRVKNRSEGIIPQKKA